ncbi:unnamed protein product [Toxocara canis]|uniref:Kringle domain-containing protein n=1 Tax=Toxocara canis TaxID=6265 RepID=A0A183VEI3_TOXCA|nr:unnamed protein product [Toxocara canis]
MGCVPSNDPMADCYGALYTPTPGEMDFRPQGCNTNMDCYDMREPPQWCRLMPNQAWTNEGCHCDPKLNACVIDRITQDYNGAYMEYAFCYPSSFWFCA